VSVDPPTHRASRARPVADLPLDAVLARADELARRWAMALVLDRPMDEIGAIPLEDLALEAPALCAQAVRALESDGELDRLTGGGAPTGREDSAPARRLAAIAGARDSATVVHAAEALRGVLWETLLEELRPQAFDRSAVRQVADLSDRLAYVCSRALAVAIATLAVPDGERRQSPADVAVAVPERDASVAAPASTDGRRVVIVDEYEHASRGPARADPSPVAEAPAGERPIERPLSWDESPPVPPQETTQERERPLSWDESPPMPPMTSSAEIEIRDERGEEGPVAWIGSIGRQLERFEQNGLRFAVLLVEVLDGERVSRDESAGEDSRLADRVARALAEELRPWSGSLTRERPGRYWLLVPETDRSSARSLAERLVKAVGPLARRDGATVEVAIGTAICPEDGHEAAALAAHADIDLYAARSAARTSVGRSAASMDEPA
jgi:GGDEF domain-containing protein